MKKYLLLFGLLLWLAQQQLNVISINIQVFVFGIGIILLGIPHGAADVLVAAQNSKHHNHIFSPLKFFIHYLGRLYLFALVLWYFPLVGNIIFILLGAYHFGETDLHKFKVNTLIGKILFFSYGLTIISTIVLLNFDEVTPIFLLFDSAAQHMETIRWIGTHQLQILYGIAGFFVLLFVLYMALYPSEFKTPHFREFIFQLPFLLFIVIKLPLILGFTFYFVVWHSTQSLSNIAKYLNFGVNNAKNVLIFKQIALYSTLAIVGIVLFGLVASKVVSNDTLLAYSFLGLAVLTAPHMQVMHDMYTHLR